MAQGYLRRGALGRSALALVVVMAALAAAVGGPPAVARAETINVGCAAVDLVAAFDSANGTAGSSRIILSAGCSYVFFSADNSGANGGNALPVVTAAGGPLTIVGNGATLARDSGAPDFRLLEVDSGADLTLNNLTLSGGSAAAVGGGAILNQGTLTIRDSTLASNVTAERGGALYSTGGAVTIRRSAAVDSSAAAEGGAIAIQAGSLLLESSSVLDNQATTSVASVGGGIWGGGGSTVTLNGVTMAGNYSEGGVNELSSAGSMTVRNSIVYDNQYGDSCDPADGIVDDGGNLQYDALDGFGACTLGVNLDPGLTFRQGSPPYRPFGEGSAAPGLGSLATCTTTDQRSIPRRLRGACDPGAVQLDVGGVLVNFDALPSASGAAAEAALNSEYGPRGLGFDAYRADLFDELTSNGADLTVFTDPAGADLLLNLEFAATGVGVNYTVNNDATNTMTARDATGTAATIETSGATVVDTQTSLFTGGLGVSGQCIRSVQLENQSPAFTIDNLSVTPQTGPDSDDDGIVDACDPLAAEPIEVSNTSDSGPGSLRQAILDANGAPGLDMISFNIAGEGVPTIAPLSNLPFITGPVVIDGLTQPGASCAAWPPTLRVELSGQAGANFGLRFATGSSGSTVRGLMINSFSADGMFVDGDGNTIQCNYVGVGPDGTSDRGNSQGGIFLNSSSDNQVGGTLPTERNLIAGNDFEQLRVAASDGNTIQGNYLGTNASGTVTLGTSSIGMLLTGGDNLIGGTAGTTPGGACTGACNIIAGYSSFGIDLAAPSGASNLIQGNHIGVDVTGAVNLSPFGGDTGIWINGSANNNTIGGTAAGAGNVIGGQDAQAILIEGAGATGNLVRGNRLGTNSAGTAAIPNGIGVLVRGGASGNTIGGLAAGAGNTIANGTGPAVRLDGGSGNSVLSNLLFDNGGGIELLNDANNDQVAPTITTAIPGYPAAGQTNVQGWLLTGPPSATYTVQLFGDTGCLAGGAAQARSFLASFPVTTAADGTAPLTSTLALTLPAGNFVSATATDAGGNTSALATCAPVGPDNTAWYQALPLSGGGEGISQQLALSEQVRWYYIEVQPRSRVVVNLSNLPAGYDLALFNDLNARAEAMVVEAAEALTTTLAVAQTQLDYDTIEASNFITNALSPEQYSPEAFTSQALAPAVYRPDVIAETVVSPFKFSPFKFSPFKFSPFKFSPFKFSPFKFSDLAGLVVDTGLLSYTDFEGTLPRTLTLNTYADGGRIYIAVYGRNGAFDPVRPFTLTASTSGDACSALTPPAVAGPLIVPQAGSYRTLFLTDLTRLPGSAAERQGLVDLLNGPAGSPGTGFLDRPEIGGVLIDLSADARVVAAQATADANPGCPEAKNFVADEVKRVIDGYRALNSGLRYLVIGGGDEVIPFYRYPDQALLGNESEFKPPVRNESSSEAALRLGYILGQDEYGARFAVDFRTTRLAIPDLAVGRLVETAPEAMTMIQRYLTDGGVIAPQRSFVSGYDFHFESSSAIADSLDAGTGAPVDTLLSPSTDSYQEPGTWTATDLRDALSTGDYDLLYLAGHFSDGALKAADYSSFLRASELAAIPSTQLYGALVVSPGCHSGYNTPDGAAITGATDQPDWAQFFARRGTALVAGTGYQYGDTQFTQFAEELYVRFFEQLRIDTDFSSTAGDEVAIGEALVLAKQRYLLDSAVIRGIDKKTLTISSLYGLPMSRVNMLGERLEARPLPPLPEEFGPLVPLGDPGDDYNLEASVVDVSPDLTVATLDLNSLEDDTVQTTTYVQGETPADVIARPGEPVLPLSQYSVGRDQRQLRGAIFLRGDYSELDGVLPLTGAPATELRGVHVTFPTEAFYPEKWWTLNQIGELTGVSGDSRSRLQLTGAQFLADPGLATGTLRYYNRPLEFRLFYSDQTAADAQGVNPALSGTPSIPVVSFTRDGALVRFVVSANGGGAPLREVWVTYTADAGPFDNSWDSLALLPSADDPSRYEGSLALPVGTRDFSFFVQAVNATGFTALNTNLGLYFKAGGLLAGGVVEPPPPPPVPPTSQNAVATTLNLGLPADPTYGQPATFTAQLSAAGGADVGARPLTLSVGTQTATATTSAGGLASFTLTLIGTGEQPVAATFGGDTALLPATVSAGLSIARQQPALSASPANPSVSQGTPVTITGLLTDQEGGIRDARLYLSINGAVVSARTGPEGAAALAAPTLPPGVYPYTVTFLLVPTPGGLIEESDGRYLPDTATGTLTVVGATPSPVANDQTVTTNEDTAVALTLSVSNPGGGALSYRIVSGPASGALSGTAPSLIYTPGANFAGADSFTYEVCASGSTSLCDQATVAITVVAVNDPPTLAVAPGALCLADFRGQVSLAPGDVDTAAAGLTLTPASSNTTLVPLSNISFGGSGASRTMTVATVAGRSGTATVTVTVSDGAASASLAFTVRAGTGGADSMSGAVGPSIFFGGRGSDALNGGPGADLLCGGPGADAINGDLGNDTLDGGTENDSLNGGGGDDRLLGGDGSDALDGGAGNDIIEGGAGNDTINGGTGNDTIAAGDGSDTASGGDGNDTISGGLGSDTLSGDAGDDTIAADDGNDRLAGGAGNDQLTGGLGADRFDGGAGTDVATDFNAAQGDRQVNIP